MTPVADALLYDVPVEPASLPAKPAVRLTETGQFRYLLLMRFLVVNLLGVAMLGVAWAQGWTARIMAADATHICALILAVFIVGMAWAGRKVLMLSRELNALDDPAKADGTRVGAFMADIAGREGHTRGALAATLKLKLVQRIAPVRHIASALVLLGLIGTIVGFIIALSGVDPETVSDAAAIGPMVATLLLGMSMALFKTLVGSVLNIWLMVNYRLLESGTVHLLTHLVELGERHADL